MGKHDKSENYNEKPYNQHADPIHNADEFDRQYMQNRTYTVTPNLDKYHKDQGNKDQGNE